MRDTAIEDYIKKNLEEGFEHVENVDTEKGGIYVETTEDHRGWMLGDKTRKIYKVPDLYIKGLTDLLVIVFPNNDDGSEIRVLVYNPRDTARMLLSKNDDVGSSIRYARIEAPEPTELIAKMGTHVCIESLSRGNWIRVHVFPGSNILELINYSKSQIPKFLEDHRKALKKVLPELVDKYYDIEKDINTILSRLERHGKICNCDEPVVLKQVYEGKFDDVIQTCISCGGTIER
jgi:hypothetical protein